MLENNLIGFSEDKEYLPKDFDEFNSIIKLRQLFLSLSNNTLKSYCNFSKYEQKKLSKFHLKEAFVYKIKEFFPFSFVRTSKININFKFNFCINSTKIINNYLNPKMQETIFIPNKNLLPLAKIISICFTDNKMQLLIDKHLLFHEMERY